MVETLKDTKWTRFQHMMQNSFNSNWYLVMELIIAIVGFAFNYELIAMASLLVLLSVNFILCEDCTSSMFTFCLVCIIPLAFYGAKAKDFFSLAWLFLFLPTGFIAHLCLYKRKTIDQGDMMLAIGLYAIALLLGGIGSITTEAYFKITPLYYILILGPGMICFYIYFIAYIPNNTSKVIDYLTRAMIMLGVMIILMWASQIIKDYIAGEEIGIFLPYRQWKNNIGNFTLLAMPFAFYASTYKKGGFLYLILGLVEYACIVLSQCRGATVAATVLLPFMIIATIIFAKGKGKKISLISTLIILIGLATTLFFLNKTEILTKLEALISAGSSGRNHLYDEAWQNFLSNPIFGVGIGYRNDEVYSLQAMSMFWYHSTFMQVIGSMGIIGLLAWGYMTFVRFKILLKKNAFNIFMLFAFLGFEGYSMINTGDFSPFPFATFLTFLLTVTMKNNDYLKASEKEKAHETFMQEIKAARQKHSTNTVPDQA